ncbi:MAG: hypothetical protein U0414_23290 [Polyangiaceae bacterium]
MAARGDGRAERDGSGVRARSGARARARLHGRALEAVFARVARADLKGALADAEHLEAEAIGPERFDAACRAGRALLDAGHVREARARFERALRYQPARAEGVLGLAEALRDGGQSRRAIDLFGRAVELAERVREPEIADTARVELARLLATAGRDVPAAIARLGEVAHRGRLGCEARMHEARLRWELGDAVGAERVLLRLRNLAETMPAEGDHAPRVARILLEGARLEDTIGESARAEALLRQALRFDPSDREIGRELRRLVGARVRAPEPVAPAPFAQPFAPAPFAQPMEPAPLVQPMEPVARAQPIEPAPQAPLDLLEDPGTHEAEIEDLTQKLRANPADAVVAERLAHLLEITGRDLELLALLSARVDESSDADRARLVEERDRVLDVLAEKARREGRASEAELYVTMKSS